MPKKKWKTERKKEKKEMISLLFNQFSNELLAESFLSFLFVVYIHHRSYIHTGNHHNLYDALFLLFGVV